MKILIRPHDIGKGSADWLGKTAFEWGFDGVQLAIAKAVEGQNGNPGTLTPQVIDEIRTGFNRYNVEIPILGAYFNPVHSNKEKVELGAQKYADHLRHAKEFGAKFVATESGSYNDDKWTYNPKNQTEEAFKEVKKVFERMPKIAEESGVCMAIEGAWGHCMYKPEVLKRLADEIDPGQKNFRFIVDIYNYLYMGNHEKRSEIFETCLKLFKGKICGFHLKDYVVKDGELELAPLGQGIMGWKDFLPVIMEQEPNAYLIFEGVKDVPASLKFVRSITG
ncbi:sugar phosphate isomerase/epimerase [Treponema pectinovorum]|uniref:sugar phosphate isomerase/epimerase family protein n=1 Tax=Treponema pectinovorum TaxID=164 RepID=UPI003D9030BA